MAKTYPPCDYAPAPRSASRTSNAPEQCRDVYRGVRYADGLEVPAVSSTQKAAA